MSFVSTASTLNIGDGSSNTVNITEATTLNLGKTGGSAVFNVVPTSIATQPASTDSSTKIPTTAWVQGAINTYTVNYNTTQNITTPSNCRFIDIFVVSRGGNCGASITVPPIYYGGGGSGGNIASASCVLVGPGQILNIVVDNTTSNVIEASGYYQVQFNGTNLVKVFNGCNGTDSVGGTSLGGITNTTDSSTNNIYGTWKTAFGSPGSVGTSTRPSVSSPFMCPKHIYSWVNGLNGTGQRSTDNATPTGLISITYHCA